MACGIPPTRDKSRPSAVKSWIRNHRTTRKFPRDLLQGIGSLDYGS